jgi:hypothetical protein
MEMIKTAVSNEGKSSATAETLVLAVKAFMELLHAAVASEMKATAQTCCEDRSGIRVKANEDTFSRIPLNANP